MIVDNATDFVNYHHDTTFTSDEILVRFENLAARHHCFRTILGHPGLTWDVAKNIITATDAIWEKFTSVSMIFITIIF